MDIKKVIEEARMARQVAQYDLDMKLTKADVDEVSVLFHTRKEFDDFQELTRMEDGIDYYHTDAQVMYRKVKTPGGYVRKYAYHALFNFFRMRDGWRLQTQVQYRVNPVIFARDPIFDVPSGLPVHVSWRVDDLDKTVKELDAPITEMFASNHGDSAYLMREVGDIPYLHPRFRR